MPTPPSLEALPIATDNAELGPALEGYTFEGYRNRRRLGRNAQHPRHHDDGAMRLRRSRARGAPDPHRAVAEVRQRRRRGGPRAHLWLRRGDRGGRRRDPDPHAAQHQLQSELRRRHHGRQSRLREAAARAPAACRRGARQRQGRGGRLRSRHAAGSLACRLRRHGRLDHGDGGAASCRFWTNAVARPARPPLSSSACNAAAATRSPG